MSEYIERERVIAYFEDADPDVLENYGEDGGSMWGFSRSKAIEIICSVPTADVEPIRHGTWVYDPNAMDYNLGGWVCSLCGVRNNNIWGRPDIAPLRFAGSKYCPACGCRMDGND